MVDVEEVPTTITVVDIIVKNVMVPTAITSRSLRSMAKNDPKCTNYCKEEDEDNNGDCKQIEGSARKDRVFLSF